MEKVLSDGTACRKFILDTIASADHQLQIAMAYFTDDDIAKAIIKATERGVKATLILSDDPKNQIIEGLLSPRMEVITYISGPRGVMHHKFCIVDNNLLAQGTYNYTYNAHLYNKESLNITDSSAAVQAYQVIFKELYMEAKGLAFTTENKTAKSAENFIENFTDELQNHISSIIDNYDQQKIIDDGRNTAELTGGSEQVFRTKLDRFLAEAQTKINSDPTTKTVILAKMATSFQNAVSNNQQEREAAVSLANSNSQNKIAIIQAKIDNEHLEKREIQKQIEDSKNEKTRLDAEITQLTEEVNEIDRLIVVKKFWTFPSALKISLILLFFVYLAFFFGSSIWKIFFETEEINNLLNAGITPRKPPLFDANSLIKIFEKKGQFFGYLASFFFLIPVLLVSIKLLTSNKWITIIFGWIIGIFIIDIVVSILISKQAFEINQLLVGNDEEWTLKEAIASAEFWLIFIFGALPLFITKMLIENVWNAYNNSNPEFVNREKYLYKVQLRRKIVDKGIRIDEIELGIKSLEEKISTITETIRNFEDQKGEISSELNQKRTSLIEKEQNKNNLLRNIHNSFVSNVESANRKLLSNVISGKIAAFKIGFYQHLTSYYAAAVASKKIESLDDVHTKWLTQNFN